MSKRRKKSSYVIVAMYILYFMCCVVLYYRQSIQLDGKYYSDLMLHIEFGLSGKDNYSIVYFLYKILYNITQNTWLISLFLAGVSVGTVGLTFCILRYFLSENNIDISDEKIHLFSFFGCFAMSIYVPGIYEYSYYGTISGQAWHNSTYIIMRALGIWVLLLYFKIEKIYLNKKVEFKLVISFIIGLIIVNMVKPNFILAFAPVMGIKLFIDMISNRRILNKKYFYRIVLFGCMVLPSISILLFQSYILYNPQSKNGIAIDVGYTLCQIGNPFMKIVLGLTFPILVLLYCYKDLFRDRIYSTAWGIWGISFLEYFLFVETGFRKNHGNFSWGMMFGTFFLFVVSIYKFMQYDCKVECQKNRNTKWYMKILNIVLICHVMSGVYYFVHLFIGGDYGI